MFQHAGRRKSIPWKRSGTSKVIADLQVARRFDLLAPKTNDDDSSEEKIEALAEIICQAGDPRRDLADPRSDLADPKRDLANPRSEQTERGR